MKLIYRYLKHNSEKPNIKYFEKAGNAYALISLDGGEAVDFTDVELVEPTTTHKAHTLFLVSMRSDLSDSSIQEPIRKIKLFYSVYKQFQGLFKVVCVSTRKDQGPKLETINTARL